MSLSPRTTLLALVALPLLAAIGLAVVISVGGALPSGPLAPDPPRNLAEALARSDAATAAWLLQTGADPNAIYEIRRGLLNGELNLRVRPLAAAAYTADDAVVRVAKRYGAQLSPDEARAVACWLAGRGREEIARMVAPPDWAAKACAASGEQR